ncbi:hypothetical protein ACFLU5_09410 [Bacteroidota bacterium]
MSEQKNNNIEGKSPQLEQYGMILSYHQYENSTFWTRSGFMLVAHSALLGFVVQIHPNFNPCLAQWDKIVITSIMGITGLALLIIWWKALKLGERWITKWHTLLRHLEPKAFGDIKVFRRDDTSANSKSYKRIGVRKIAYSVVWVFLVLWSLVLIYGIGIGIMKLSAM